MKIAKCCCEEAEDKDSDSEPDEGNAFIALVNFCQSNDVVYTSQTPTSQRTGEAKPCQYRNQQISIML